MISLRNMNNPVNLASLPNQLKRKKNPNLNNQGREIHGMTMEVTHLIQNQWSRSNHQVQNLNQPESETHGTMTVEIHSILNLSSRIVLRIRRESLPIFGMTLLQIMITGFRKLEVEMMMVFQLQVVQVVAGEHRGSLIMTPTTMAVGIIHQEVGMILRTHQKQEIHSHNLMIMTQWISTRMLVSQSKRQRNPLSQMRQTRMMMYQHINQLQSQRRRKEEIYSVGSMNLIAPLNLGIMDQDSRFRMRMMIS